jgi:signal transduction histidine kinase
VLGVVANDLRNPLQTIRGRTCSASSHGHSERRSRNPLERITRAVRHMERLFKDVLDLANVDAVLNTRTPLAAWASLTPRLDVEADPSDIDADFDRLQQVLANLIGNASKFTQPGGVAAVGARRDDADVLFSVTETGTGIPPETVPRVFERFWQATRFDAVARGSAYRSPRAS